MKIEKFIDKIIANCKERSLEKYQIVYNEIESDSVSVFEQKVLKNTSTNNLTLSLSVIVNGKLGKFVTEKFDADDINMIVKQAIINAEIVENEDEVFFHDGSGEYKKISPYKPLADKLSRLDKLEFLKELESKAYSLDKKVNKVMSAVLGTSKSKKIMKNSLGLDLSEEYDFAYSYLYLSATDGKVNKTGGDFIDFSKVDDFNPEKLAKKAVKKAVSRLGGMDTVSRKASVVFENETFAGLLDSVKDIFSAYIVDKGYSKLKDKIGKKVAGTKVTIFDNPHLEGGYATHSFDGEGVPTKDKVVVKDGILQTFLYNLSMANKYKTVSTGNGSGALGTRTFNFYIKKGCITKKELLKILNEGVYINNLNGIHAGVDIVSGDFSLGAEGFLVEAGKITKPLNQFTISGNIYDMLLDIEEVANDLEFKGEPVGSPSVLINNITIASS